MASIPSFAAERSAWLRLVEASTLEDFSRSWLSLLCSLLGEVRSAILVLRSGDEARFKPVAFWPEDHRDGRSLQEAAERALRERQEVILNGNGNGEEPGGSGPPGAGSHRLGHPIFQGGNLLGVVALELPGTNGFDLPSVRKQVAWASDWFEVFHHRTRGPKALPSLERLQAVLELVSTIVERGAFRPAAMAFVTDIATRLSCSRVSVGFLRKGRVQVIAVSHSAHFGKKTDLVRAIEAAMEEAIDQEALVVFPEIPGAGFRITQAHAELARQCGPDIIVSIPLTSRGRPLGALTLERAPEKPFDSADLSLCETAAALAGPVLDLEWRDDRWLGAKAVESFREQVRKLLGPRHALRKLVALGALAVTLFFLLARATYHLSATTVLEGAIQRAAVSPFSGFVASAPRRAGDVVRKEEVLCVLDDRDLKLERQRIASQRDQLAKQHQQALAKHDAAQAGIVAAQIDQAEAQLALVEDQLSRMRVTSPLEGMVVKGDLSHSIGAPVEKGDVLFEVAPLDDYRLILQVDESDIREVAPGQRGSLLLSALPTSPLPFLVERVVPVSTAREGRNFFRVEARLEDATDRLRPGMEGVGKIEVGRRHLIWIWTRRAVDWLRLFVWSWTP